MAPEGDKIMREETKFEMNGNKTAAKAGTYSGTSSTGADDGNFPEIRLTGKSSGGIVIDGAQEQVHLRVSD